MYSGLVSSIEVKLALELIICVLTLLYNVLILLICPHTTLSMCSHTSLYVVKLALERIPLLQRVRTHYFFFTIYFFGHAQHTHTHTHSQTDGHTHTVVKLKLEQYVT